MTKKENTFVILRVLCVFVVKGLVFLDIQGNISYYPLMNAVAKSPNGIRAWTDAQRAEQAAKLHAHKIWLKSTGPRTTEGKLKSSQNARSINYQERQEMKAILRYLRTQKSYIYLLNIFHKQWDRLNANQHEAVESRLCFFENELIAIERQIFGGLTFSETISGNIIAFPNPPPPCRGK